MIGRGGSRPGAGRKRSKVKELRELVADKFFRAAGGELESWTQFIEEVKPRIAEVGCDCGSKTCSGMRTVKMGDIKAWGETLRYWTDRKYGKAIQPAEHTGKDGNPISVVVEHIGNTNQAPA